jgi:hypothetical protein
MASRSVFSDTLGSMAKLCLLNPDAAASSSSFLYDLIKSLVGCFYVPNQKET